MTQRIRLLPLWLRLWHWTSAVLLMTLAASGVSLHFSSPGAFLIPFRLAREIHALAGISLATAYVFFLAANAVTGNWRQYLCAQPGLLDRCLVQTRYYLWNIFRGLPQPFPATPEVKFNALQQVIYTLVMYVGMPVLVTTGLLFLFPELAPDHLFGVDGLLPLAMAHYMTAFCIFMFTVGHIYLATTGKTPTSLIRTMVTGWKEG